MNRFNRTNPGLGKVPRIPNRGCVSYSAGSGKAVDKVKIRVKSVSFGEGDQVHKDRAQRHFEAVRATLHPGQENYGTLQRSQKYASPEYAEINTLSTNKGLDTLRFSEYRAIEPVPQPPVTYKMCSTDFGMDTLRKNKSTPDINLQQGTGAVYGAKEKIVHQYPMLPVKDGVSTLRKAKSTIDVIPHGAMDSALYTREQTIAHKFLRPDGLPYRASQLPHQHDESAIYRPTNRGLETRPDMSAPSYSTDTLDRRQMKQQRPRRPATAHECNVDDADYYTKFDLSAERNRKANADYFNALQQQGAERRQSSIPHGYRTASYRLAVTSPRNKKLLAALPTARYDAITEAESQGNDIPAPYRHSSKPPSPRVGMNSGTLKKKTDVHNDDYVSMENLTNLLAARTTGSVQKSMGRPRPKSLPIQKVYDLPDTYQQTKKPVPIPSQPQLKGILKNSGKYIVNGSNSGPKKSVSTASKVVHVSSSPTSPQASTVERNGLLLTSFPVDKHDGKTDDNKHDKVKFKGTVVQHTAQVHQTPVPPLPLNPVDQCKSSSVCTPESPNWPAPPPPLETTLAPASTLPPLSSTRSTKRPAPPVPKKTPSPRKTATQDSDKKNRRSTNEPASGELLAYLRRIAIHGPDRSPSKCSQDSDAMTLDSEHSDWSKYQDVNHNTNFSEDDYFSYDEDEFDDFDETENDDDDYDER